MAPRSTHYTAARNVSGSPRVSKRGLLTETVGRKPANYMESIYDD